MNLIGLCPVLQGRHIHLIGSGGRSGFPAFGFAVRGGFFTDILLLPRRFALCQRGIFLLAHRRGLRRQSGFAVRESFNLHRLFGLRLRLNRHGFGTGQGLMKRQIHIVLLRLRLCARSCFLSGCNLGRPPEQRQKALRQGRNFFGIRVDVFPNPDAEKKGNTKKDNHSDNQNRQSGLPQPYFKFPDVPRAHGFSLHFYRRAHAHYLQRIDQHLAHRLDQRQARGRKRRIVRDHLVFVVVAVKQARQLV